MPKFSLEEIKTRIAAARKLSLALIDDPKAKEKQEKVVFTPEEQKARLVGKAIRKMTSVCESGKTEIANLLNVVLDIEIKPEYYGGGSRYGLRYQLSHSDFTVIIPTEEDKGFAKGKPVLVLGEGTYCLRGTGSVREVSYFGDNHCRKATETEVNQFYDLLLAYSSISLSLSPKFAVPV